MLRAFIKIITLPLVISAKIMRRLFRPSRIARRLFRKRNLVAIGTIAAAAAARQHANKV
ncbi:MAG: hypothetical protein ACI8RZ_003492 [Myxococcota bacterium]|jgi:hypothetical protein